MWETESTESRADSFYSSSKRKFLQGQSVFCDFRTTWLDKFTFSISYILKKWEEKQPRLLLAAGKNLCSFKQKEAVIRILHGTQGSQYLLHSPFFSLSLSVTFLCFSLHIYFIVSEQTSLFCSSVYMTCLSMPHDFTKYKQFLLKENWIFASGLNSQGKASDWFNLNQVSIFGPITFDAGGGGRPRPRSRISAMNITLFPQGKTGSSQKRRCRQRPPRDE